MSTEVIKWQFVGKDEAPFTCRYCGMPSWIEPTDQQPPPDYCHESDHGTLEDRELYVGHLHAL